MDKTRGIGNYQVKESSITRINQSESKRNNDIIGEDSIIGAQQSFEILSHKASKEASLSID